MSGEMLLIPILIPIIMGAAMMLLPKGTSWLKETFLLLAAAVTLIFTALLFGKEIDYVFPWMQWGSISVDFSLRLNSFSGFIILAVSSFSFLAALYSTVFMKKHQAKKSFYAYMLFTVGFVNGAALSNNMVLLLFFWEGLLVLLFAMIMTGGAKASATAVKALVLNGVADLCLMLGALILIFSSGTSSLENMHVQVDGNWQGTLSFILMMIGAIAKAGSLPFHSWIPDAAVDAPLPFMALLPAALEKLIGIYLLARLSLDIFSFQPGSAMSIVMMTIGAATILIAVMMALIQKDYKRLLAYHAISQVGYMILGIGTALPIGIVGGLFHMINHAMYKSTLFYTGGSVEKQAGTTNLEKLGGLARKMPVTFGCFIVSAAAISGVPPFNGFFSKELVFGAAMRVNVVFYIAAALGAFLTAASFLKLGHAVYLGKPSPENKNVREAPWPMLVPMIVIAAGCVLFGVWNALPLNNLIQPILGSRMEGETFVGHTDWLLTGISVGVLLLALLNHLYGVRKTGRGLAAVDHIHYAPGLKQVYGLAERRYFDPYDIGMKIVNAFASALWYVDRGIDWIYNGLSVKVLNTASHYIRKAHTGSHWLYICWILGGLTLISVLIAVLI